MTSPSVSPRGKPQCGVRDAGCRHRRGCLGHDDGCDGSARADVVLWAREDEVVEAVNTRHENTVFLPGVDLPASLRATPNLEEAVQGRDVVVMAVPAQHVRSVGSALAGLLPSDAPVVSLTKGIEQHTLLRPTEVLAQVLAREDQPPPSACCPVPTWPARSQAASLRRR